jgi:CRISPR-associated endonuclease/helicase Cas3
VQDYDSFFEQATGKRPYAYQRALAVAEQLPSVLDVPTGSGKTHALLVSWLYQRRMQGRGPRRLVYALPMRSLVEQTARVATNVWSRTRGSQTDDLGIHVLMGGVPKPTEDWRRFPDADQILIGTIDMLLSSALNRGYADSRYQWPISFGLLNADSRWVFDEIQLMGPARATSAQLDGLRTKLGSALRCETIWVSATVDRASLITVDREVLGASLTLPDEDRQSDALKRRLNARKVLERADLSTVRAADQPRTIASLARDRHVAGTRTIVVVNRVERAQAVYSALSRLLGAADAPRAILLHSRFRSGERAKHMESAIDPPKAAGTIVIATQVIEAGVDVSSRTLITDLAPFSSIVQRVGRCNRAGESDEAAVLWLDPGEVRDDTAGRRVAAPYLPSDVAATREALLELDGQSLSPEMIAGFRDVEESVDDPVLLRRRDLLDLFDTAPDLSGLDVDIAPFIRDDDERNVAVFFRELDEQPPVSMEAPLPAPAELVQVPVASLRGRNCWTIDFVNGIWIRRRDGAVPPGSTVMLNARDGGYTAALGWSPRTTRAPVGVVEIPWRTSEPEAVGSDDDNLGQTAQELLDHLQAVADETMRLADALSLDAWRDVLHSAAALHDVGKAHDVFQATLRDLIDVERHPNRDSAIWAKSGRKGGSHARRRFRHELASLLAVAQVTDVIHLPHAPLTLYLIAAHHGRVRLSIRPAPEEARPDGVPDAARFALGIADGDKLPDVATPLGTVPATTLDLDLMELGSTRSWSNDALSLRDDPQLGPFRLGFLEALLRMADWRASA